MYLLALFSPFLSFFFSLMFGKKIGSIGVIINMIIILFTSFFCSIYLYYEVCLSGSFCIINMYKLINIGYFDIDIVFFFDVVTSIMVLVVIFISFLVHLYSIEYMAYDPSFNRFMSYLSIFTFFMLILVSADIFYKCL